MTTHRASASALLALAAVLGACEGATGPGSAAAPGPRGAATGGERGTTTEVIRGVVIGLSLADSTETRLAGATITAYRREGPKVRTDSALTPPTLTRQGTTTSDASGNFELTGVPAAYYVLDVVAPAGSGYADGRAGSESLPAASSDRARVYLYRLR